MTRRRFLAVMVIIASTMGAAAWIGDGWQAGLISFAIVLAPQLVFAFVPWKGFELLGPGPKDERQQNLGTEALAITAIAVGLLALGGGIVRLARDQPPGEYGLICVVGGVTFWAAMLILPRVR